MANSETRIRPRRRLSTSLLAMATLAPVTLSGLGKLFGGTVPAWVSAAISAAALSGALVMLGRQRETRGIFLAALAVAVVVAAAAGWWASGAT